MYVCNDEHVIFHFTGSGWTYNWLNSNPAIGLPASGTGDLDFIATNLGNTPLVAEMILYPFQGTCGGSPESWLIFVMPVPFINPPADVSVCAGAFVSLPAFTGTNNANFQWTNSNPAIGLSASGSGNIVFTAAQVPSTQTATITVTPMMADCAGDPVTFNITVGVTSADDPPDITVCPGDPVSVDFTGNGSSYNWTNNNPAIGLGASGSGNINFTASGTGAQQIATVTVNALGGTCPPKAQTFTITVLSLPTVNQPPNVSVCTGATVSVN
ncbi:MAG TPA: hypothetical protein PK228_20895, partial [Saprospiraceae bacterium]|nr:hypothetical protein [Saprospiraceae bacterium]